jgi:hypothetical protein
MYESYLARAAKVTRENRIQVTPFDRLCWEYSKAGSDPSYIAVMMNASVEEVTEGVTAVERWKAANSREIVEAAMNEQAILAIEPVGRTLAAAQSARRLVAAAVYHPKTGEVLRDAEYAPDYQTQIAATEAVARIVESVQARGPGVQVNVGGNQLHLNGGGGRSFEERLRMQREKRGMREREMDVVTIDGGAAEVMRDGSAGDTDDDEEELEDELEMEDDTEDDTESDTEDGE